MSVGRPHGFLANFWISTNAALTLPRTAWPHAIRALKETGTIFTASYPPTKTAAIHGWHALTDGGADLYGVAASHPKLSTPAGGTVVAGVLSMLSGGTFFQVPAWLLSTATGLLGSTLGLVGNFFKGTSKVIYGSSEAEAKIMGTVPQSVSRNTSSFFRPILKGGAVAATGTGVGFAGLVGYDAVSKTTKLQAEKSGNPNEWMRNLALMIGLPSLVMSLRELILLQTAKSR